jgi:transposase-like protein
MSDKILIDENELVNFYENGTKTISDCARHFNTSNATIRKNLKLLGVYVEVLKPQKKHFQLDYETAKAYLDNGKTIKDIAKIVNAPQVQISKHLQSLGIEYNKKPNKIVKPSKEELFNLYRINSKTMSDIAKIYNTTNPTVRKWLKSYGIRLRSHREVNKNYFSETMLQRFIQERFNNCINSFDSCFPETRYRPDVRIDDLKLIVEFDGFRHYTKAEVIYSDRLKERIYKQAGYKIIRIPYFVQMDSELVSYYFKDYISDLRPYNDYPHGFIDNAVIWPSDFCIDGIDVFINDLLILSRYCPLAFKSIIDNIQDKIIDSGEAYRKYISDYLIRRLYDVGIYLEK